MIKSVAHLLIRIQSPTELPFFQLSLVEF